MYDDTLFSKTHFTLCACVLCVTCTVFMLTASGNTIASRNSATALFTSFVTSSLRHYIDVASENFFFYHVKPNGVRAENRIEDGHTGVFKFSYLINAYIV